MIPKKRQPYLWVVELLSKEKNMCQMSAVLEHDGEIELIKENITKLDVLAKGVKIVTLFEGETEFTDMSIHHIDFMAGKVFLTKNDRVAGD